MMHPLIGRGMRPLTQSEAHELLYPLAFETLVLRRMGPIIR